MLQFAKRTIRAAFVVLLAITDVAAPPASRAQHLGDVSLTTTTQTLASSVSCTGNPQLFPVANLGQSFHLATAAIISGAASFVMEVDGVDAVGNIFKISNPMITVGTASFLVQGTGFMPIIRISLTCTIGSTFSLSYSGSFASNPIANVGAGGSGNATSTVGNNVQGIIPSGQNGAPIFPVTGGGVRPAINAQTVQFGVDTFGGKNGAPFSSFTPGAGASGTFTLTPPIPSAPGEWGLAILANTQFAVANTVLGPYTCVGSNPSCVNATLPSFAALSFGTNNNFAESFTNASGPPVTTPFVQFVLFSNIPAVRQANNANQTVTNALPGNTLAGSTVVVSVTCSTVNCTIAPTSSQGQTLQQIGRVISIPTANATLSMSNWILGPTTAAALTITFNAAAGSTINGSGTIELTGLLPGSLTTPSFPLALSNPGAIAGEDDNGGLFTEAGGFDFTQTVTISTATTLSVPLWAQNQHGLFFSCTLSERVTNITGAATTLNTFLQDSADGLGFNDRLSMTQATTALGAQNLLGAVSGGVGGITPVATGDGALAAGSKLDGPLGPFGRIKFVTTGAAVSATITYNVACR